MKLFSRKRNKTEKREKTPKYGTMEKYSLGLITAEELKKNIAADIVSHAMDYKRSMESIKNAIEQHNHNVQTIKNNAKIENMCEGTKVATNMLLQITKGNYKDLRKDIHFRNVVVIQGSATGAFSCFYVANNEKPDATLIMSKEELLDFCITPEVYALGKEKNEKFHNIKTDVTREDLSQFYDICMHLSSLVDPEQKMTMEELVSRDVEYMNKGGIPETLKMFHPETGQIMLPDENGDYQPVEPNYLSMLEEIDFAEMEKLFS